MMKNSRLLLTLWLMLLTALMPPMAFSCASVCAVTVEQKMSTNHQSMMDMSSCENKATMSAAQVDQSHTEEATLCLDNAMCHLTVSICSALLPIKLLKTHSVIAAQIPAFIPQTILSLRELAHAENTLSNTVLTFEGALQLAARPQPSVAAYQAAGSRHTIIKWGS